MGKIDGKYYFEEDLKPDKKPKSVNHIKMLVVNDMLSDNIAEIVR